MKRLLSAQSAFDFGFFLPCPLICIDTKNSLVNVCTVKPVFKLSVQLKISTRRNQPLDV